MLIHISSNYICSPGTAEGVSLTVIHKLERVGSDWIKQTDSDRGEMLLMNHIYLTCLG